jgi:hypothetical protein
MPLPFLKDKEGGAAATSETVTREPDDGGEGDLLDAVADDILSAVAKKDKSLLKAALESFVVHIQSTDEAQDASLMGV